MKSLDAKLNDIHSNPSSSKSFIIADAKDADYLTNPQAYKITRRKVDADTRLKLHAVAAGGFAISIVPED